MKKYFGKNGKELHGAALAAVLKKQERLQAEQAAKLNIRQGWKVQEKTKGSGFTLENFGCEQVFEKDMLDLAKVCADYRYIKGEPMDAVDDARKAFNALAKRVSHRTKTPLVVNFSRSTVTRLQRSVASDVCRIDYDSKAPTRTWVVFEHLITTMTSFDWRVAGCEERQAKYRIEKLQKLWYERIFRVGLKVFYPDTEETITYSGMASSASHQKNEKLLMCDIRVMKKNENFFFFGKTAEYFYTNVKIDGPKLWKMRANLIRPILCPITDKDGNPIYVKDILIVPDKKKKYFIPNARVILSKGDKAFEDKETFFERIFDDGFIGSLCELSGNSQATAAGIKGFSGNIISVLNTFEMFKDIFDKKIPNIDKKMCRVGDYKMICGAGCWKFDDAFSSLQEYLDWLDKIAETTPGANMLYVLREAEEEEESFKARRLTRTLIQQWIWMSAEDQRRLTSRQRKILRSMKTLIGLYSKLSGGNKKDDEISDLQKLFRVATFLTTNKNVIAYGKSRWLSVLREAAGGKFRTEGEYPYITEDPVAFLQVYVYGMDPNDPELGVLRGDTFSYCNTPDGRKAVLIRFPANSQTAMVMTNCSCRGLFDSLNNVLVLSVHSLILIIQDGDVDGDEMAVIFNWLAIKYTSRMRKLYNPRVLVFEHGDKKEKKAFGTKDEYFTGLAESLWNAKHYDNIGIYATLAMRAMFLASIHLAEGDEAGFVERMTWAELASVGTIIGIDQIKGTEINKTLIMKLNEIIKLVYAEMKKRYGKPNPFVHAFAKNVPLHTVNEPDTRNLNDSLCDLIVRDAGDWKFDMQGACWNAKAATLAIVDFDTRLTSYREFPLSQTVKDGLRANWFNAKTDIDKDTLGKIRRNEKVGLFELIMLLYHNDQSIISRFEGKNRGEQRSAYRMACRDMIIAQANDHEWKAKDDGHIFTEEEKLQSILYCIFSRVLGLMNADFTKEYSLKEDCVAVTETSILSHIESEEEREKYIKSLMYQGYEVSDDGKVYKSNMGGLTMFLLDMFAKDLTANVEKHGYDAKDFMLMNANFEDVASLDVIEDIKDMSVVLETSEPEYTEATSEDDVEEHDAALAFLPPTDEELDASVLNDGTIEVSADDYATA